MRQCKLMGSLTLTMKTRTWIRCKLSSVPNCKREKETRRTGIQTIDELSCRKCQGTVDVVTASRWQRSAVQSVVTLQWWYSS